MLVISTPTVYRNQTQNDENENEKEKSNIKRI